MKYTQNFDIQNYEEFSQHSHLALKKYCELFHLVMSGLNGMLKRNEDYCINNDRMKQIVERCNQSFEFLVNSISTLKTEHKKFERYIENFEEISLGEPKVEPNKELGDWLKANMLTAPTEKIVENIDYLNNTYLREQLKEINNHVENLGFVWQDENYKIFADEVLSGSQELVDDFKVCSIQIKDHITQNQKDLEQTK